jgi:peptidoglycan/xylan/chitin deacetylase (PgdA/CDA1 family)
MGAVAVNLMQHLAAHFLFRLRISPQLRRRALSRGAFVLMFHGTPRSIPAALPPAARPALDRRGLALVLDWLASTGAAVLSPIAFLAGEPGVLLTFDDGFANNVENAVPELAGRGFPAIFFVTTQHVDEPENWLPAVRTSLEGFDLGELDADTRHDLFDGASAAQIAGLAEQPSITIGAHSISHPFLTRCSDQALADELGGSKVRLEAMWGRPVEWFAYPAGDYDARVAGATRAAGYRAAVAENARGVGLPSFEIPRIGIYDPSPALLEAKLSGLFRRAWRPPP